MNKPQAVPAPAELTPNQNYAHLCAQLGERHRFLKKINEDIQKLHELIDALEPTLPKAGA